MKISIENDKLVDAAQWAMRAVPANPPVPVLAGLRLDAADNRLTLTGYDYARSARAEETCEVSEPGTALVPGRVFTDLMRTLPKTAVTTLTLDGTGLALSCGTVDVSLPTLPLNEYPALPAAPAASGTVDGAALARLAPQVAVAACTDDTLPSLTGVEITLGAEELGLAATDRYSFHVATLPWSPNEHKSRAKNRPRTKGSVIVPADVIRDAARIVADTARTELTVTDSLFAVSVPGRQITGSILTGELPKYASLIPDEAATVVRVDTEALATAIRHVVPLLGKADPMLLDIAAGQITVRAGTDDKGRGRDQVDITLDGAPVTVAFNATLLLKSLLQVDAPTTQMNNTAPTKPVLLHAHDEPTDTYRALAMPIRLHSN